MNVSFEVLTHKKNRMEKVMKSIELSTHDIKDENQNEWTVIELSDLEWIMEDYHQAKLKLLNLHDVVQQRELLINFLTFYMGDENSVLPEDMITIVDTWIEN